MGRHQKSHGIRGFALAALILLFSHPAAAASDIIVLAVKDTITPPVAAYITENIDQAVRENAQAVIIRLDTPGGLDTAMRDIIQKELNSPIPIVVYV